MADIIGFLLPGVTWGPREGGWLVQERSSSLGGKRGKKKIGNSLNAHQQEEDATCSDIFIPRDGLSR